MKKNHSLYWEADSYIPLKKVIRKMKLTLLIVLLSVIQIFATSVYSQNARISLKKENTAIENVLKTIEDQSEYFFLYNGKLVDVTQKVNINVENQNLEKTLNELFRNTNIAYKVYDRQVVLSPSGSADNSQQVKSVTGKVTDTSGSLLPGVSVVIKGTTSGTITDSDGKYTISNVPENATLQFSFVGMKTLEAACGGKTSINVALVEDAIDIEEVVAVGYGVQKKTNLTGSVISVTGDDLAKRQVGQTSMALQGVAPGVTVTQRSGQPGNDGGTIRIRGIGTLGDSNPLVLADGVETNINNVDPNLIESISVLKDAASAAIYGSRAANGVILITTKRAKGNGFSINYSGYAGFQQPTDLRNMVNAHDHMSMLNTAYINAGKSPLFASSLVDTYTELSKTDPDNYPDVNWQKKVYTGSGFTQNHSLNLNGGNDNIKLMAAFGYYDQKGILENTNFKRYSIRLNSDIKFTEKFSAKMDFFLRQMETNEPAKGVSTIIYWLNRMPATQAARLSNGSYGIGWEGDNPMADALSSGINQNLTPSVMMNLGFNYKFSKSLILDAVYSPHFWEGHNKSFSKIVTTYYPDGRVAYTKPSKASLSQTNNRYQTNNVRATLNYDKNFGKHNLKLLAGWQQEDFMDRYFSAYRDTYVLPQYEVINAGSATNQQTSGAGSDWALRSFFGRVNYDFSDRYLFEANVRYDGSSRFAEGKKWGVFPSFSAGWRISEENFWKSLDSGITNLKLRGSWGQLGNQNIGTYPFDSFVNLTSIFAFNNALVNGAALTDMANGEISWETTEMQNYGLDIALLNNKLSASFDYYIRNTNGILLQLDVPKIIGLTAPYQNAGKVENKGWDLSLNYHDKKGNFSYDFGFSLSDVKNKVLDLRGINQSKLVVNYEGYPMQSILALEAEGYFTDAQDVATHAKQYGNYAPGDIKYKDQLTEDTNGDGKPDAGDGVINDKDQKIIGNTIPRYTFGLSANLAWKGFDMSVLLQGVGKADGYLMAQSVMPFYLGGTAQEQNKDYWRTDNLNAKFPRLAFNEPNNEKNSSFWMKNAAYMRLKNLQVGYTLPKRLTEQLGVKRVRTYFSGQNLLTLDKFWDGFDVEAPVGDGAYYPQVITYSLGIDVNF